MTKKIKQTQQNNDVNDDKTTNTTTNQPTPKHQIIINIYDETMDIKSSENQLQTFNILISIVKQFHKKIKDTQNLKLVK